MLVIAVFGLSVAILSPKISLEKRLLTSGKKHQELHEWSEASDDFERVVHYAPHSTAAIEAARLGGGINLYEIKDYPRAILFFRHIVRQSQKTSEVRWAQQKLAEIYYEKLNDYSQAVIEYQRLLQASPSKEESSEDRLRLGRSYFYMANFDQAIAEVSEFLSANPADQKRFDFLMLRADSLLAEKKLDEALSAYSAIEKEFASLPEVYQVKLNESLAYEEKKDWDAAVAALESIRETYPHPDVIELKIRSIQRRKARKKDL